MSRQNILVCDYCGIKTHQNTGDNAIPYDCDWDSGWWHIWIDFLGTDTKRDFCSTQCLAEWAQLEVKGKNDTE